MAEDSRKLVAILFSDIEGYSRQMDLDEAGMLSRLKDHNRIFDEQIRRHEGRVVKTIGDAFMIEFPSAVAAVACGLEVQRAIEAYNAERGDAEPIRVRIGVHVGDVVVRDGDLFGETVNVASRIELKAPPGTVCVSEAVYRQVRRKVHATGQDLGVHDLKNIAEPMQLYALKPAGEHLDGPAAAMPKPVAPAGRKPVWFAAALAALFVLVVLGVWWFYQRGSDRPGRKAMMSGPARSRRGIEGRKPSAAPVRGGVLNVGIPLSRGSFDYFGSVITLSGHAMSFVIEPLVTLTPDGEAVPGVVERWNLRDGGRKLDLYLRKGVYFHDHPCLPGGKGRMADPRDLSYSIQLAVRHGSFQLRVSGLSDFKTGKTKQLGGVTVGAGGVVTISFDRPSPFSDVILNLIGLLPVELENCDNVRDFKQPVGTGPFRFTSATGGESIALKRAPKYWRRGSRGEVLPYLDGLTLQHVASTLSALQRLRGGELHVLVLPKGDVEKLLDHPYTSQPSLKDKYAGLGVRVGVELPEETAVFLGLFIVRHEGPLGAPLVRKALGFALDRKKLSKEVKGGIRPLGRFMLPRFLGHDPRVEGFVSDPEKAKRLLASAGHPQGRGIGPVTLAAFVSVRSLARAVAAQLGALGLRIRVVDMSVANVEAALKQKQVDGLVGRYVSATRGTEPYPFLPGLVGVLQRYGYRSARAGELVNQVLAEQSRPERGRLYAAIEKVLLENPPVLPIGYPPPTIPRLHALVSNRVGNLVDPVTGVITYPEGGTFHRVYLRTTAGSASGSGGGADLDRK